MAVLLAPAGIVLLIRGFRGRRVDDHPLCRKCGFDLTGKPSDSDRCPECGAFLSSPTAVRIGHRQRRTGAVVVGTVILLLSAVVATPPVLMHVSQFEVQRYKPMWLLRRDAASSNAPTRSTALREMLRRLRDNELSAETARSLVSLSLDVQADLSKPWHRDWGNIVQLARAQQAVTDEQWLRYTRGSIKTELLVRARVPMGDAVMAGVRVSGDRIGDNRTFYVAYADRDASLSINDIPIPKNKRGGVTSGSAGVGAGGSTTIGSNIDVKPILDRLKEGKATARYRSVLRLREGHKDEDQEIGKLDVDVTADFELRPAGEQTVAIRTDESFRAAMEKAITVDGLKFQQRDPNYAIITIRVDAPPVGMGYKIFAVWDGHERVLGAFSCVAGTRNYSWGLGSDLKGMPFDITSIDVVLRPDVDIATRSLNTFEIWGGQITVKNVKVTRPTPPATRPAS